MTRLYVLLPLHAEAAVGHHEVDPLAGSVGQDEPPQLADVLRLEDVAVAVDPADAVEGLEGLGPAGEKLLELEVVAGVLERETEPLSVV